MYNPLVLLALGFAAYLPSTYGAEIGDPQFRAEVEQRMEEARQQLDRAARQLAEISRTAYQTEFFSRSTRPVVGVVLAGHGDSDGLLLAGITPDGGAVEAGLQAGDRLIAINGERLDGEGEEPIKRLNKVLETVTAGDSVQLEYVRDETVYLANVVTQERRAYVVRMLGGFPDLTIELPGLGELSEFMEFGKLSAHSALEKFNGLHWRTADTDHGVAFAGNPTQLVDVDARLGAYFGVDGGVLVVSSADGSELQSGDILLEVAGSEVATVADVYRALHNAQGEVEAKVWRNKQVEFIQMAASASPHVRHFFSGHGPHKQAIWIEQHGSDDVDVGIVVDDD
ncbi:MAG: PDZ domain-containing protein [Gammaproteobacteria bacterium]|nr:PDZ domain-containing protein [Gammaproteobacteria bacterium]